MAIVYANIGSNIGDSRDLIEKAIQRIGERFGYYCISRFVESDPWGFESTNRFLNIGISFKTSEHPEEVLKSLQEIERSLTSVAHRDSKGNYKDRELDIDIMAIDDLQYHSANLTLPHPHLYERDFFLLPLKELKVH